MALLKLIEDLKIKTVVDVGAGSGYFSKQILQHTSATEAICVDIGYTKEATEPYLGKKIHYSKTISRIDSELVLLLDVIEHIENDADFLSEYVTKADSGTYFCITVPAFQFLFSSHDKFLEHFRRYSLGGLTSCVQKSNLKILKISYFFGLLFPFIAIFRLVAKLKTRLSNAPPRSDLKMHGALVNSIMTLAHQIEILFFPRNRAFGLTIFCLAVKK
jgi:hypothetical protein